MKEIGRGAEAIIYKDKDKVVKHRVSKKYRIKRLDDSLRKYRHRREVKILAKLSVPKPELLLDDEENKIIEMEFIDGSVLKDVFKSSYLKKVGEYVAKMHNQGIIHGDLTTSNMILKEGEIYFIDFGLSFFSSKVEDKAVDLHVFKEALKAKHYKVAQKAFKEFLKGYKTVKNYKEIMGRLQKVEARGRYKGKE
ncbi:Kae1-associated serine/threonine protein kinase [Candidatus Woesearchaeota archaeon]|nr:Kae1-associated serine/threonine protein kinase [Candidatus Woesearchaeota archaeon]